MLAGSICEYFFSAISRCTSTTSKRSTKPSNGTSRLLKVTSGRSCREYFSALQQSCDAGGRWPDYGSACARDILTRCGCMAGRIWACVRSYRMRRRLHYPFCCVESLLLSRLDVRPLGGACAFLFHFGGFF